MVIDGLGLEIRVRVSPAGMVVTSSVSTKASSSPSVKPAESSMECAGEEALDLVAMGPSNSLESVSASAHADISSKVGGAMSFVRSRF